MGVLQRLLRGSAGVDAPRVDVPGVDALRTFAVLAVLYCHISYYLVDALQASWVPIGLVDAVLVEGARLNRHLTFIGVATFMMITGLLITRSAITNSRRRFLINRIGRLLPSLWVAVFVAIVLVRIGVNHMFTGQDGISNFEAISSFFLGGFWAKPEVAVLQVTWTLVVQVLFYFFCVAARPLLRSTPVAVPILGALLCEGMLLYNQLVPADATVPMLSKIAATMPAILLGQVFYLYWARLAPWPWLVIAGLAQLEVLTMAQDMHAYGLDKHYVRTMILVAVCVAVLAKRNGPVARSAVVRWIGTRSYAIYLVHTLILYRTYELTVGKLGTTGAIVAFLIVTAVVSEILYRWVELPGGRWISRTFLTKERMIDGVTSKHVVVRGTAGAGQPEIDDGHARTGPVGPNRPDSAT